MYQRILLPTDGSESAHAALDHALDIARQYDAELHVLHVVSAAYAEGGPGHATAVEALEEHGEETFERIRERTEALDVETACEQRHGEPHAVIVEYADDADCDLTVMGTHGRTGLQRYLLGSVTEKVVRTSDVPVLTVRHGGSGE
ncbi:universal stress protein uspa-like protein [Salinarchaeum sp. Harcht-Bsk1]|uniref:universal stress protein n=1 Tax=Salinarchaeum sp. Harcht-Bsk1 TaxID=1333523 RepID=UPI0003423997|nr:universal stress protein [Salinarchaeum sp. Harcht-Bsk1]AGN01776.1 universal stress protein uspa-like protein [Salinarchaeum sp. Harcht-Bsk1]